MYMERVEDKNTSTILKGRGEFLEKPHVDDREGMEMIIT
jgi:hypothetical protein